MSRLAVLDEQLRTLKMSLESDGSVVPENIAAVGQRVVGQTPVNTVVGEGVNAAVAFTADFSGHVLEDRFKMVVLPPDIGILNIGFRERIRNGSMRCSDAAGICFRGGIKRR
jgi:hypothetical protein